jgi:hypothetical protein
MTMYDQGIEPRKRSYPSRHPFVFSAIVVATAFIVLVIVGVVVSGGKTATDASVATGTASANPAPGKSATARHAQSWGDGTYEVGVDIKPGKYRSPGQTEEAPECYWARLKSSNDIDIISNNASSGPQIVVIKPTDKYFLSTGCQPWIKAG